MEKENGHDDICPLPGAKLCFQLLILVWDFLPSSGSPFIGLFCVKMFSLLLVVSLVSRQSDARVEKTPNNCLYCLQQISAQVMMVLMMTMMIKMKLMIMRTNIFVTESN